ncbi:MAG: hypothetical protein A2X35_00020 [Elusimicrobia bacterium GWA2_61_42]|nr:MAG: hypothetical protein A2X35_00020 [Elusimicrobia bacterium GWA2_61_42]OGR78079.1 MAG: hypothetical protein A2X38_06725 [Elusimicrobia bacterium GWC2_61_25]
MPKSGKGTPSAVNISRKRGFSYNIGVKKILVRRFRSAAALLLAFFVAFAALALLAEGLYRLSLFGSARFAEGQGDFELYAMGESSMEGSPFYRSPPAIVSLLFSHTLAGRNLRVINLAYGGNSVYPQAIKTIRALKYRNRAAPAALLIYSGHNENILGYARAALPQRAYELFKRRVLIHSLLFSEAALRLERRFLFYGVRDLAHYEHYLRAAIEAALDAGAVPIVSTLASNISGVEPGEGRLTPGIERALGLELAGRYGEAARQYSRLAEDPASDAGASSLLPYLEYRLGRCLQSMGKPAAAKEHLLKALETDPLPFRAKPSQNEVIRGLAEEYGIPLLDAEKLFAGRSADGLPGSDLFVDHVHPDAGGYMLLSGAFAGLLGREFGGKVRRDLPGPSAMSALGSGRLSDKSTPYLLAGTYVLWFSWSSVPIPDRLALAEKNFRRALKLPGANNLAAVGLRVVVLSRKNRNMIPEEVYDWFKGKRFNFEYLQPLSAEELAAADKFLRGWESGG